MKKTLLLIFLIAFCNLTLFAQTGKVSRMVHTKEKSAIHVPPQEAPAGLKKIYSNLGKSQTDLYVDNAAWEILGPDAVFRANPVFIAIPFTAKFNSHVSKIGTAIQYQGKGANQVNLSIYGDADGVPGTLLAGPVTVTNLPAWGTCCALTVANLSPIAVDGGTQYWVVADTPLTGTGSDFMGAWDVGVKSLPMAANTGSGWYSDSGYNLPATEVLGTIP